MGVVLFNMVYGAHPFGGNTEVDVIWEIANSSPRFPDTSNWVHPVPGGIKELIAKALEKDPGKRFEDMAKMRDAILDVDDGLITFGHGHDGIQLRRQPDMQMMPVFGTMDMIERITARLSGSIPFSEQITEEIRP